MNSSINLQKKALVLSIRSLDKSLFKVKNDLIKFV